MNTRPTDGYGTPPATPPEKRGGLLGNLLFNIVIPTLIMTKFSGEQHLGPLMAIVVALAFPVVYGIRDYLQAHKPNFFSILGVVSVVLTGTMSLLKLPPEYIAIKEAAIPGLFGLATLISVNTRWPLVKTFLFIEQVLKVNLVHEALSKYGNEQHFEMKLKNASYMVAGSSFLSSGSFAQAAKSLTNVPRISMAVPGSLTAGERARPAISESTTSPNRGSSSKVRSSPMRNAPAIRVGSKVFLEPGSTITKAKGRSGAQNVPGKAATVIRSSVSSA